MKRLTSGTEVILDEERPRRRREWVKNAIIIFLALMLVLTFFSNTIMNWSLPEVAAQYPQSTTITTKIRGSGTVAAAQTYNVTVQEARTVSQVNVKAGDTVKIGDTLLTLDEQESQALADARAALSALQLEYEKMQLSKDDQDHAAEASLQQARDAVASAESELYAAQQYESDLRWYQDQVTSAQETLSSRQQSAGEAQSRVEALAASATEEAVINGNAEYLDAVRQVDSWAAEGANSPESPHYADYQAAVNERDRLYREQIAPELAELTQALSSARQAAADASSAVASAQAALDSATADLTQYTNNHEAKSTSAAEAALQAARDALSSAEAAAADADAQKTYDAAVAQMDLEAKAREVKSAQDKVAALEAKSSAAQIISRYNGVVQTVNVAAGDVTAPETPVMVVELTEQGYTLNAAVTKEQARFLREGMNAEITNLWDSGITLTLSSITVDQANPAANRTLTFVVQGESVLVGQTLSFSIGDQNASYDVVIPSAAVHTDADGSFVYTVVVKPSPLGNRYTVRKTKVEVIASDDTQSAVTGDLSTADFVITTATVPLQPGDQVRIAE